LNNLNNDISENESKILSIKSLFRELGSCLQIPSYQRPYSWKENQVRALIDDIVEAWEQRRKAYLVGNLIFHKEEVKSNNDVDKNNTVLNIVDGQQRIITFALIFKALSKDSENEFLQQKVSSLSIKRLKENNNLIQSIFRYFEQINQLDEIKKYIEKNVIVSYLVANTQDEAFLFFDSQNTRGKPLVRKDLLKVHHIRHMQNEIKEIPSFGPALIKFVKQWEEDEKNDSDLPYLGKEKDFLEFLFDQILGLARKAVRRELDPSDLTKVDVYKEFVSCGVARKLNNYNQPPLFESYAYDLESDLVRFDTKLIPFQGPYSVKGFDWMPFEITQSIAGGSGFFLFTRKYVALLKKLRENEYFTILDGVTGAGNGYLRKIYRASLAYFFDKFGNDKISDFAIHLFLLLAYFRANSGAVYDRGVVKFQWGDGNAVFDPFKEILLAYSPNHIIENMRVYVRYHCQKPKDNDKQKWFENKFTGTIKDFWDGSRKHEHLRVNIFQELWGIQSGDQK